MSSYKIKSKVFIYPSEHARWYFIFIPEKDSEKINKKFSNLKRGFGSLPVKVTLRKSVWVTSIFPDKRSGGYLLPLKSQIRKKENIYDGDVVSFKIEILK